jgi:hypothetical protein
MLPSEQHQFNSDVAKGIESLRQGNKSDLRESQVYALAAHNKSISDINKYLFTIASLLIPLVASLIGIEDIRKNLNQVDKAIIIESIVLIIFSVLFGFIHTITDALFFKTWLDNVEERLKLWSTTSFWPTNPSNVANHLDEYESLRKKADHIQDKIARTSSRLPIFIQGLCLLFAILLIAVVALNLVSRA